MWYSLRASRLAAIAMSFVAVVPLVFAAPTPSHPSSEPYRPETREPHPNAVHQSNPGPTLVRRDLVEREAHRSVTS